MSNYPHGDNYDFHGQQNRYGPQTDNNMGLWAMILGIISLFACGFILGIPAILMGVSGRRKAEAGLATNDGQAQAGIVLGSISTVISAIGLIIVLGNLGGSHSSDRSISQFGSDMDVHGGNYATQPQYPPQTPW
jgi:Domain of unknown function (DUF4190)